MTHAGNSKMNTGNVKYCSKMKTSNSKMNIGNSYLYLQTGAVAKPWRRGEGRWTWFRLSRL
jgi:hypothetical protein